MNQLIQSLINRIKKDFPDLVELNSVQAGYIRSLEKMKTKASAIEYHLKEAIKINLKK